MREIVLTLIAAMVLLGCSDEPTPVAPDEQKAIGFGNVDTRAINSASDIQEFGVFIEQNLGAKGTDEYLQWISLRESERVYRDVNRLFVYDNKCYWVDDREFFFFGYYPYGAIVARSDEVNSDGETTINYSMNITIPYAANSDYMIAQCTKSTTGVTEYPIVDMKFSHLLSKVSFRIQKSEEHNANDTFIVTQIGLSGVSRTGIYNITHTPTRYTEELSIIPENRNIRRNNLGVEINTSGVDILSGDGFLVLPQAIDDGKIKLTITYTYQQDGSSDITYNTKEIDIPVSAVGEWVSNKSYMYNLTLDVDNSIYISTPTVTGWGSMQTGGTIIIQ